MTRGTEDLIRGWQSGLAATNETFSRQTRVLNSLDTTLSRQRKSINSIQTDLCGLSAAQYRLKFQLETLENYQSDLEVALAKIEEDTHELVRHGPGAVQLDRNDRLFCFAESMSAQLKDVCEKIQDVSSITWFIPITQSDQEGSSSLSKYVNILNRQLATLKSLEGEIAQLSVD
ncbi:predicted protein [Ostreococcus lucimarinus CCE9901]|uniref:Nucleoporin NSP1-like C-terminal domain-containing protein n=1 Tax=Ostreococcus lucimarinus (strain CCE9901) TaxID=436017 RepID=A4RSP1_OSTLU|nr:predicted protein [Ostreococcus lucimarinus CCE9901]ABO94749.1 predicted protein [Ostreococcus lucimarinus CCE9901]|eukprot:XP_001416456.1 predicted protein [Ostreococcus lucimarinus CCE9901]